MTVPERVCGSQGDVMVWCEWQDARSHCQADMGTATVDPMQDPLTSSSVRHGVQAHPRSPSCSVHRATVQTGAASTASTAPARATSTCRGLHMLQVLLETLRCDEEARTWNQRGAFRTCLVPTRSCVGIGRAIAGPVRCGGEARGASSRTGACVEVTNGTRCM